jgi:hypothetical protein
MVEAGTISEMVPMVIAQPSSFAARKGTMLHCYKRFVSSFTGPVENKAASSATTS